MESSKEDITLHALAPVAAELASGWMANRKGKAGVFPSTLVRSEQSIDDLGYRRDDKNRCTAEKQYEGKGSHVAAL